MEVWKRREHELAHIWKMKDYVGNDAERPDFKFEYVVDPITNHHKKVSFINSYLRRLFVEFPIIIVSLGAVIGCYIAYFKIYKATRDNIVGGLINTVVYALVIVILGIIYKKVA